MVGGSFEDSVTRISSTVLALLNILVFVTEKFELVGNFVVSILL